MFGDGSFFNSFWTLTYHNWIEIGLNIIVLVLNSFVADFQNIRVTIKFKSLSVMIMIWKVVVKVLAVDRHSSGRHP